MAIFEHEDNSGDAFEIGDSPRAGELALYWAEDNASYVNIPRGVVRSLRDALNRWLDEQQSRDPNPAGLRPESVYSGSVAETLVRRLVAEEVARVLPLHQSPQAVGWVLPDRMRPQEPEPQHATNTGLRLCIDPGCSVPAATHAEHDPEPKAVGHPEAPGIDWTDKSGVRYEYCTECGHVWGIHAPDDSRSGCVATLGKGRCGCEAIRPERPAGCECGHSWTDHGRFGIRGCGVLPCECSRAVPRSTS